MYTDGSFFLSGRVEVVRNARRGEEKEEESELLRRGRGSGILMEFIDRCVLIFSTHTHVALLIMFPRTI